MASSAIRIHGERSDVFVLRAETEVFDTSGTIQQHNWKSGQTITCAYYPDAHTAQFVLECAKTKAYGTKAWSKFPELPKESCLYFKCFSPSHQRLQKHKIMEYYVTQVPAYLFAGRYYRLNKDLSIGPLLSMQKSLSERDIKEVSAF